ncbi:DNA excision repair protein ERCC-6 [Phytophthora pseudosyringae]|uniref:DNA excision repair protein ERCC-6 n=1 Tax=Phytophthora pseudosyringae TaxID=221518 RepID=A0A8T1VHP0_9STRA|nr:DNA excision repair protein ERCC-6 [Phytophthora pseudosyringae]
MTLLLLKWLHAITIVGCTTLAMDSAAAQDRMEVAKWLRANRSEGCTIKAIEYAIAYGSLRVVSWVRSHLFLRKVFDTCYFCVCTTLPCSRQNLDGVPRAASHMSGLIAVTLCSKRG